MKISVEINFFSRPSIIFESGLAGRVGSILKGRNKKRSLIFTDQGIIASGLVEGIIDSLKKNSIKHDIFADIETNPAKSIIENCKTKTEDFNPDIIIALGCGSVIDTAKATAFYYSNPDLIPLGNGGELKGNYNKFPVITIPTTAGTGSEITSWAVITDPDIPEKVSIGGEHLAPVLSILDPEMTLTLPEKLTMWTGLDAFIHALEAYLSRQSNDYVDEIAYLALKYIINNLPRAVEDGLNLEAREKMMLGSYLAGWAMENVGLGLIHGMSHQVGAFYHHHHGLLNALLLPPVVEYNYSACADKMNIINEIFQNNSEQNLVTGIRNYYDMLDFKTEITIRETDIPTMARMAVLNVNSKTNPRTPVQEEVENLYHRAFNVEKDK